MYYIQGKPNEAGYCGNPAGEPFDGAAALPDGLLSEYIAANGFVRIQMQDGVITGVEKNEEAWAAWKASLPDDPGPEPAPELTWDTLAAAIREGVDSV